VSDRKELAALEEARLTLWVRGPDKAAPCAICARQRYEAMIHGLDEVIAIERKKAESPAEAAPPPVRAAVAYVTRPNGKILVVWNKRYGRWAMPGGKVKAGETLEVAVLRELLEEAGLRPAAPPEFLYEGPHGESVETTRGSVVSVFAVEPYAPVTACEMEPGCPVTWFTREEFLAWGLAPEFYRRMFRAMEANP
jgi:8-oxo-dGTP pyrophosphatase MutT (NUDIX family)